MTDSTRERLAAILAEMSPESLAALTNPSRDWWLARADRALAAGVTLPEPPAPAPPKPTWHPSREAFDILEDWVRGDDNSAGDQLLRRLYAQLHRDRVAALPSPAWKDWEGRDVSDPDPGFATVRDRSGGSVSLQRRFLLALADDGNEGRGE